jgi:hypothetical protein
VVEVEERALGALEQDVIAAAERVLDEPGRVVELAAQALAPRGGLLHEWLDREAGGAHRLEQEVLVGQGAADPLAQDLAVEEVLHPQAQAPGPVPVRRADAPAGGADLRAAQPGLVGPVEGDVVGHDHVRAAADPDLRAVDALRREHVELRDEGRGVDHHAVADDRRDVRVHDAGRAELELHGLAADHDRVPRVVAALVAHDHRDLLREEVGRLALALVAPLEADDHRRGHRPPPDMKRPRPMVPGSWIDVSRAGPPLRRAGGSKVRSRLTGRTTRLPRSMVSSSIAGQAPRSLEDRVSIANPDGRRPPATPVGGASDGQARDKPRCTGGR